jgi:hypothetical protein
VLLVLGRPVVVGLMLTIAGQEQQKWNRKIDNQKIQTRH